MIGLNNVVYLKIFENDVIYVGITKKFNKRMKRHELETKKGTNRPLYDTIRKYSHYIEIIMWSELYKECLEYEKNNNNNNNKF